MSECDIFFNPLVVFGQIRGQSGGSCLNISGTTMIDAIDKLLTVKECSAQNE